VQGSVGLTRVQGVAHGVGTDVSRRNIRPIARSVWSSHRSIAAVAMCKVSAKDRLIGAANTGATRVAAEGRVSMRYCPSAEMWGAVKSAAEMGGTVKPAAVSSSSVSTSAVPASRGGVGSGRHRHCQGDSDCQLEFCHFVLPILSPARPPSHHGNSAQRAEKFPIAAI
jgi:hypothetical protein